MADKDDDALPEGPINAGRPPAPAPEFADPAAKGTLAFRDPSWVWLPVGLLVSPWIGAAAPALLLAFPEFSGAGSPAGPVVSGVWVLGLFGVAASALFGGVWFTLTAKRRRTRRLTVILECGLIGLLFATLLGAALAVGAAAAPSSATGGEAAAGALKMIGGFAVLGLAIGLPAGLVAGAPFSVFAFRRV